MTFPNNIPLTAEIPVWKIHNDSSNVFSSKILVVGNVEALSPLKRSSGLRMQLRKCLIAFLLHPTHIGWQNSPRWILFKTATSTFCNFSSGLSCTEEFPLQWAVLNALPSLWKSNFCLWDNQDNRILVVGICLQSPCFSYLRLLLYCADSGVSTGWGRKQKDPGQRQSLVCAEWVSSGKISPGKDLSPGSAGRTDYDIWKSVLWVTNLFRRAFTGWTLRSQLLENFW